jgi:hypothetical protein
MLPFVCSLTVAKLANQNKARIELINQGTLAAGRKSLSRRGMFLVIEANLTPPHQCEPRWTRTGSLKDSLRDDVSFHGPVTGRVSALYET